jgi:competence protein ComEA
MQATSRSQLVLYAAIGITLVIVGVRWIHAGGGTSASASGFETSTAASSSGGGSSAGFSVGGAATGEDVVVDVTGAVGDSGVYRLPAGARVEDAVKRAGGAKAGADLEHINLAARLSDGQQVVVPARIPAAVVASPGPGAGSPATAADPVADGPISLSTATVADLDTIEGIGPVTAQDIVDFRDQHGGIGSVEDLNQISGIGPATMEALRARLQP